MFPLLCMGLFCLATLLDFPSPQLKPIQNDRSFRPADRPLPQLARRAPRPHLRELRGDAAMVGARSRRLLAQHLGLFRSAIADAVRGRARRAQDARRGLVSRRAGQLCAAGVPACRRGACRRPAGDRQRRRGRRAARDAAGPSCGARRPRSRCICSDKGVKPGDRVAAYLPNIAETIDRVPRLRQHRRDLERLRARHGPRPPCSTASARSSRRC